jgi:hypothetical protein
VSFLKLQFRPGVNRDQTNYSSEGGWYECDKIRFRSGYPEKIGGWVKSTPTAFFGVCRQLWNWITSYSDNFLSLGTNNKVYIESGGIFNDITPLRATAPTLTSPNTNNCVATTNGSDVVTINLGTTHDAETGSFVTISGVTGDIGGIPDAEINANHQITVIDTDSFSFSVSTAASSTVAAGGGTSITISFEIAPGYATTTAGYGWGAGTWGRGYWGLGSTAPVLFPQRDWWFDNFDNDLVMNVRNGAGYWWVRGTTVDPGTALATRAIALSAYATSEGFTANSVPVKIMQLLVSQNDKHLIAFGAVPFGSTSEADFDPLLIRWADQDTPGDWTPSTTNTAGDLRVSRGSSIIRAMPTRQEILVWTDTHLYSLQFLGTSDVFGLQEYADNVSIISSRACATAANVTYWMGQDKFYAYTGRVETLPCTLRNHVFKNINTEQTDQIVCGTNEGWNEIWWFYPSAQSSWNDSYVVFNHLEKIWYYGTIERTAWLDTPLRAYPQACNSDSTAASGYLYSHEAGLDDDEIAMEAYIQSNDFDLGDGDKFMLTRRVIPDVGFSGSTATTPEVTMQLRPRNFPGSAYRGDAQDTRNVIESSVDVYTEQVFIRARARQMAFKIASSALGVNWQVGSPRLDMREDGLK